MIDEIVITAQGGNGGDGAISFRREKYVPRGGPDGGDGGWGGAVVLAAGRELFGLVKLQQRKAYVAEAGVSGGSRKKTGRNGQDLYLVVPVGTAVEVWSGSGEGWVEELVEEGQEVVVARGGEGGRGNCRFATAINQVPRLAEKGEVGERVQVRLELKTLADIGLVGLPNAGKTTFLRAISAARPPVGAYPFTTLEPNLGVASVGWRNVVVADVPGLIEGAHTGKGLGARFLRHVERTAVLVHVVDGSEEDPVGAWEAVNRELGLFNEVLARKPQVVVVNKMDLPEVQARAESIRAAFAERGVRPYFVSAASSEGVGAVIEVAVKLEEAEKESLRPAEKAPPPGRIMPKPHEDGPLVKREVTGAFVVLHRPSVRLAVGTDLTHPEAWTQFQGELERNGVLQELERAGVQSGDLVRFGDVELEWA